MHSLSARLLVLTIVFVMIAEVLIFVPSVARFRQAYLEEKLHIGHLAILTLDATPDGMVADDLKYQLLDHVGAHLIAARRGDAKATIMETMPPHVDKTVTLDQDSVPTLIRDAMMTLSSDGSAVLRVTGASPKDPLAEIEVVISEAGLYENMVDFAWRIFLLSLIISLITATLVFAALQWMFVRPMRRITASMVAFSADPEDATRTMEPTGRKDEIGRAERELAGMQTALRQALRQKDHLAALGTAVAKVNHDLKGILSRALLLSDRLQDSEDPEVRRIGPSIIAAIERAAALCGETLNYVGHDNTPVNRTRFELKPLVEDVRATLDGEISVDLDLPEGLQLAADREQIYRVLSNLGRNAFEAGADRLRIEAARNGQSVRIDVCDDGPGLSPRAQENLFRPFRGSTRAGGTGLGLAIARELVRGHGGDLELVSTGAEGTRFRLEIPA